MGDNDGAAAFDGTTNGSASSSTLVQGPSQLTVEAWVRTTSAAGGKIVGFGNAQTGTAAATTAICTSTARAAPSSACTTAEPRWSAARRRWRTAASTTWSGRCPGGQSRSTSTAGRRHQRDSSSAQSVQRLLAGRRRQPRQLAEQADQQLPRRDDRRRRVYPAALSVGTGAAPLTSTAVARLADRRRPTDTLGKADLRGPPDIYWRLDESSGTTVTDSVGERQRRQVLRWRDPGAGASPVSGTSGTAVKFNGSSGSVGSSSSCLSPTVLHRGAVVQDHHHARRQDHRLRGPADRRSTELRPPRVHAPDDRQLRFGTRTTAMNIVTSPLGYNDGTWHQLVATQSGAGMRLYVDGQLVGSDRADRCAELHRLLAGGRRQLLGRTSDYFAGTIDEVAVWSDTALTAPRSTSLYQASPAATTTSNKPPVAAIGAELHQPGVHVRRLRIQRPRRQRGVVRLGRSPAGRAGAGRRRRSPSRRPAPTRSRCRSPTTVAWLVRRLPASPSPRRTRHPRR